MMRTKLNNRGWRAWFATAAISLLLGMSAMAQLVPPPSSSITINDTPALPPPYVATPYPSEIEIKDTVGTITQLKVMLGTLNHSYSRDVAILLVGPNGNSIVLMDNVGDGPLASVKLTFSDTGDTLAVNSPIQSGEYKPVNNGGTQFPNPAGGVLPVNYTTLSEFNGISANGKWKLYVVDRKPFDSGTLGSWTLSIETTPTVALNKTAVHIMENTSTNVTITLKDSSTPEGNLVVTAKSPNTTLFPAAGLVVSGTGATRTLTITPKTFESGTNTVTVTVDDGKNKVTADVLVEVEHVNNAPTLTLNKGNITLVAGTLDASLIAYPADVDNPANFYSAVSLSVQASSDPAVVPVGAVTFTTNTPYARPFSVFGMKEGTTTLTIKATDEFGASGTANLIVTVTAPPQPYFSKTDAITVSGSAVSSTLTVANVSGKLGKVMVALVAPQYIAPNTLVATLTGPNSIGPIALTPTPPSVAATVSYGALTFSDVGGSVLPTYNTPTNVLVLAADLNNQQGKDPNGTWTLNITGGNVSAASKIAGGWFLKIFPAPTIPTASDVVMDEKGTATTTFTVADQDGTVTNVSAVVLSPVLAEVKASLSGNVGTLVITALDHLNGQTQIQLQAKDNLGLVGTRNINLTVRSVNDAPTISFIEKQVTYLGSPILNIPFTIADVDNRVSDLRVSVASSNEKVIPLSGILIQPGNGSDVAARTISLFPVTAGSATITLTVVDTNNVAATTVFPVFVQDAGNRTWPVPGTITVAADSKASPYYPSTNTVSGMKGTVAEVQVTLFNINDQSPGDLRVLLVGPNSNSVVLMGNVIGNNPVTGTTIVFSDAAPATLPTGSPVSSGIYKPTIGPEFTWPLASPAPTAAAFGTLAAAFNGTDPNGNWTLYIDSKKITGSQGKEGRIDGGWMLSIRTGPKIEPIKDIEIRQNEPRRVQIVVGDNQPGVNFTVTATSTVPSVIKSPLTVTGTGGLREVLVDPVDLAIGDARVEIWATDGVNTSSNSFAVKVVRQDLPPRITTVSDKNTFAGVPLAPFEVKVYDPQWDPVTNNTVKLDIIPANPAFISKIVIDPPIVDTTSARKGTNTFLVYITPAGVETGSTKITISAQGTLKATSEFVLTIKDNLAYGNSKPIIIPEGLPIDGLASPYPSTATVPRAGDAKIGGLVSKAWVTLVGFKHAYPQDVQILLEHNGKAVVLMSNAGTNLSVVNPIRLTFSDAAANTLPATDQIVEGTYKPSNLRNPTYSFPAPAPGSGYSSTLTAAFDNADPNGTWNLYVLDSAYPDGGQITEGWILFLETKPAFVSAPSTYTFNENELGSFSFDVTDAAVDPARTEIVVTAAVTGTQAPANLMQTLTVVSNSPTRRTVTLLAATNQPSASYWANLVAKTTPTNGTATVRLTANVGGRINTKDVAVTVAYKNQLPYVIPEASEIYFDEQTSKSFTYKVADVDSKWQTNNTRIYFADTSILGANNITISYPYTVKASDQAPDQGPLAPEAAQVYTVTLTPKTGAYGTNTLYIVQTDSTEPSRATTNTVKIGVKDIWQNPTLTLPSASDLYVKAGGTSSSNLVVTVGSTEVAADALQVTVKSLDTSFVPNDPRYIVVGGSGTSRTINVTAIGTRTGTVPMEVSVNDGKVIIKRTFNVIVTSPAGVRTQYAYTEPVSAPNGLRSFALPAVSGLVGKIYTVSVLLDGLTTVSPADLDIMLEAVKLPSESTNKAVMLMAAAGGSNPVSARRVRFDRSATVQVPQLDPIVDGTYLPGVYIKTTPPAPAPQYFTANLGDFENLDPNREWRLWINNRGNNTASLTGGWSITIVTKPKIEITSPVGNTITMLANQTTNVTVRLSDDYGTEGKNLKLEVTSSNPVLLPLRNISLGDANALTRTTTLKPDSYQFGTTKVVYTVKKDNIAQSSDEITLNVLPINDAPTVSRLADRFVPQNTPLTVDFVVSDPDSQLKNLKISATTDNEAVISKTNVLFFGTSNPLLGLPANTVPQSSLVSMTITPTQFAKGKVTITLTIEDPMPGVGTNVVQVPLVVDVQEYNWPPVIVGPGNQAMSGNSTAEFKFKVSSPNSPAPAIAVSGASSDPSLVKNANITIDPNNVTTVDRTLRIRTEPWPANAVDPKNVTITLTATDGRTNSVSSFVLTVNPPRERTYSNTGRITIVDNSKADVYPSVISVSDLIGNISRVTASVNGFGHSFPSDVGMLLVSPAGDKLVLMNKAGAGSPRVGGLNLAFNQAAANPIPATGTLTSGEWQPADYSGGVAFPAPAPAPAYTNTFNAFKGKLAAGNWSLYVYDSVAGDAGEITNGWSVSIETEPRFIGLNNVAFMEGEQSIQRFMVADDARFNPTYTLTGWSSNPDVIPNSGITFDASTGTNRTITLTPKANASGSNITVFVWVKNGDGQNVTNTFKADVMYRQTAPNITPVADMTIETGTFKTVSFAYWDAHTATNALRLGITSSNPTLVPVGNIKASPTSLLVVPVPGQVGSAQVSITVTNADNLVASTSFNVTVTPSKGSLFVGPAVTIKQSGAADPYGSTNVVSGVSGNISKVTVGLAGFSHTFPSDVSMLLVGPTGKSVVLLSRAGAGFAINNTYLTFDDAGPVVPQYAAITDGTFKPTDYKASDFYPAPAPVAPYGATLSEFVGTNPNGPWALFVYDEIAPDSGAIAYGWTLNITTGAGKTVVIGQGPSLRLSQAANGMTLSINGAPNVDYTIQSTTDMSNWTDAATVTADDQGRAQYSVTPNAAGAQFFRALAK